MLRLLPSLRPLLALPALLALGACSPPEIDVTVRQLHGRWMVTLSQDWGLFSGRKPPCIGSVSLAQGNTGMETPIWSMATNEVQCLNLKAFTIGSPPAGFTQERPLPRDVHGNYILIVHGIGWGEATLTL